MPGPYAQELRDDVGSIARTLAENVTLKQIAAAFGISKASLTNWLKQADAEA